MPVLDDILRQKLKLLESKRQKRAPVETEALEGVRVRRGGKTLISFSSNDYLGLARHPKIIAAAAAALKKYGAGAGASRLVTGDHPLYEKLEAALAKYKGAQAACVFGSGYLANLGAIPAIVGKNDLILADRLCHACMLDAAKVSDATFMRFAHNNIEHCKMLLEANRGEHQHCLIITETVFSMDGDRAPLHALKDLARQFDAWLLTDDAHGLGIPSPHRGEAGRGASHVRDYPIPNVREFARELRKEMTSAEQMLWRFLRGKQLGARFRKQHPVGPYIADFVCLEHKLIIELDGSQHAEPHIAKKDEERKYFLEGEGFELLRFWNNELFENTEGVLETIYNKISAYRECPHPNPPPAGEGIIEMGTLSKAAGSYGGYVCGSKTLVEYLKTAARSLIYSTALPPATVAASLKAIEIMAAEPGLGKKALENARLFTSLLGMKDAESAVVPVIVKENDKALRLSERLEKKGFLVAAIRPPSVPENSARLRFAFSALHEKKDIEAVAGILKKEGLCVPSP